MIIRYGFLAVLLGIFLNANSLTDIEFNTDDNAMMYLILGILVYVAIIYYWLTRKRRRREFIENYSFPSALDVSLSRFSVSEKEQVLEGLRAYFLLLTQAHNVKFFVPSKVLLETWRAFIELDEYKKFSKKAFGVVIIPPTRSKKIKKDTLRNAFKTVWSLAQEQEGKEKTSQKLPSIFNLDRVLAVPKGTLYRFKKNKERGSKKRRKERNQHTFTSESSFSISYSSDEYSEFSFELGKMESTVTTEKNMGEYSDNVGYHSSSDSSDGNSSSSSSGFSGFFGGDSDSDSGSSSSSSSDSGSSSGGGDSGGD